MDLWPFCIVVIFWENCKTSLNHLNKSLLITLCTSQFIWCQPSNSFNMYIIIFCFIKCWGVSPKKYFWASFELLEKRLFFSYFLRDKKIIFRRDFFPLCKSCLILLMNYISFERNNNEFSKWAMAIIVMINFVISYKL